MLKKKISVKKLLTLEEGLAVVMYVVAKNWRLVLVIRSHEGFYFLGFQESGVIDWKRSYRKLIIAVAFTIRKMTTDGWLDDEEEALQCPCCYWDWRIEKWILFSKYLNIIDSEVIFGKCVFRLFNILPLGFKFCIFKMRAGGALCESDCRCT